MTRIFHITFGPSDGNFSTYNYSTSGGHYRRLIGTAINNSVFTDEIIKTKAVSNVARRLSSWRNVAKGKLALEKFLKTVNNEYSKTRRSLLRAEHLHSFRRLNEPLWMCGGPLPEQDVGMPAPRNSTLYLPDGRTQDVAQGDLMQNHMVGAMACPCYYIPTGTVAPVDGIWKASACTPGTTAPHPGRLCMTLPSSIANYNFEQYAKIRWILVQYMMENNTCAHWHIMLSHAKMAELFLPLPYVVSCSSML